MENCLEKVKELSSTQENPVDAFMEKLLAYLKSIGYPTTRIKSSSFKKSEEDIYNLYKIINDYGGYYRVSKLKLFQQISETLKFHPLVMPVNIINFYKKYLLRFAETFGDIDNVQTTPVSFALDELNGQSLLIESNQPRFTSSPMEEQSSNNVLANFVTNDALEADSAAAALSPNISAENSYFVQPQSTFSMAPSEYFNPYAIPVPVAPLTPSFFMPQTPSGMGFHFGNEVHHMRCIQTQQQMFLNGMRQPQIGAPFCYYPYPMNPMVMGFPQFIPPSAPRFAVPKTSYPVQLPVLRPLNSQFAKDTASTTVKRQEKRAVENKDENLVFKRRRQEPVNIEESKENSGTKRLRRDERVAVEKAHESAENSGSKRRKLTKPARASTSE